MADSVEAVEVGGQPLVILQAEAGEPNRPRLLRAVVAPGRGMLLAGLTGWLPGRGEVELIHGPSPEALPALLDGGEQDFNGNAAFSFGGAILLPFANRVRGREGPEHTLEVDIEGHAYRLPRNWGGKAPGAETYAMHGLLLDAAFEVDELSASRVSARFAAGDFGGRWPSHLEVAVSHTLTSAALTLTVEAVNVGQEPCPVGIGWHPYFNLVGERAAARLTLPAAARLEVNNYDEVLPTGRTRPVSGTPYDFRAGAALGDLYLDDCFVGLEKPGGLLAIEIADAACRLQVSSRSEAVQAVQVYAPPDRPIVVIEPQFNRPDPFARAWAGQSGMVRLQPGEKTAYQVSVSFGGLA